MESVSILIVDNPFFSTSKMDSQRSYSDVNYSLYFAGSGKNGLDILLGDPYHEVITLEADKIKPSVVIVGKELTDISTYEFLSTIRRYYSLRGTKIFLLSDSFSDAERLAYAKLCVVGYLQRPLDIRHFIKEIYPLSKNKKAFQVLIPLAFLKTKLAQAGIRTLVSSKMIGGVSVGTKIAACFVSALVISATVFNA